MKVYLDNAATTPIDPQVAEAMIPYLRGRFGNPSSTHSHGREVKAAMELNRKSIAELLRVTPGEIFFTSGGTESINTILRSAASKFKLTQAITSPVEHHAVLHVLEQMQEEGLLELKLLHVDGKGHIDQDQLESFLRTKRKSLVSLMHANNEIGNFNDIGTIGQLCSEYQAYFHSDTVQSMGHLPIDLSALQVDAAVCSAHKIHGPKGVGFMYVKKDRKIPSFLIGGGQERNMRGGTENVIGIAGLTKAFELAHKDLEGQITLIRSLKSRMVDQLTKLIPGVKFNGDSALENSLCTVLSASLPPLENKDMLLFRLDLEGISVSGGSACNSGAQKGSHVLEAIGVDPDRPCIRFSFSKFNTPVEIDHAAVSLAAIVNSK